MSDPNQDTPVSQPELLKQIQDDIAKLTDLNRKALILTLGIDTTKLDSLNSFAKYIVAGITVQGQLKYEFSQLNPLEALGLLEIVSPDIKAKVISGPSKQEPTKAQS